MSQPSPSAPSLVDVDLNYTVKTSQRPVNYAFPPPEGVPLRSGEVEKRRVRVRNARLEVETPALDRNGFQLVRHATALRDFGDKRNVHVVLVVDVNFDVDGCRFITSPWMEDR